MGQQAKLKAIEHNLKTCRVAFLFVMCLFLLPVYVPLYERELHCIGVIVTLLWIYVNCVHGTKIDISNTNHCANCVSHIQFVNSSSSPS